jgi:hypothetical protein
MMQDFSCDDMGKSVFVQDWNETYTYYIGTQKYIRQAIALA